MSIETILQQLVDAVKDNTAAVRDLTLKVAPVGADLSPPKAEPATRQRKKAAPAVPDLPGEPLPSMEGKTDVLAAQAPEPVQADMFEDEPATVSLDDVREALVALPREQAQAIVRKYGSKLSEIPASKYAAMLADAKKVGA